MKNNCAEIIIIMGLILGIILMMAGCIDCEMSYMDLSDPNSENSLICITTASLLDPEDWEKEFVINTQEEYQSLLEYKSPTLSCEDFILPQIDFSQKALLGKYTSGGGCSVDFVREVCRDDLNKKIILLIAVIEEGLCEMMVVSMNWTLIPKIPSDYDVEFIVFKVKR